MDEKLRFVAVEFPDDINVAGRLFWYLCPEDLAVGDKVSAPLGRHNRLQTGVVHKVIYATESDAPYPLYLIKSVKKAETNSTLADRQQGGDGEE